MIAQQFKDDDNDEYPEPPSGAIWKFIRTCQECDAPHIATRPNPGPLSNAYANRACRKCGSEALDYGSERWFTDEDAFKRFMKGKA